MADEQAVTIIKRLLWFEVPLLLLFFANIYFANKPNGGFWIGNNKMLTIFVLEITIILIVLSAVTVGLADTDDETAYIFTVMGVIAPGVIMITYACIYAYPLIFSKAPSGSTPGPVTKGGGRAHRITGKSKK